MEEQPPQTPSTPPQQPGDSSQGSMDQGGGSDVEEGKVWAAIGYLGILFLIPLFAKKDNDFAQYHAKQGLVLFVAGLVASFIGVVPFLGWIIAPLIGIFTFILFIMGLMNALGGKKKPLPVIGKYGENINV